MENTKSTNSNNVQNIEDFKLTKKYGAYVYDLQQIMKVLEIFNNSLQKYKHYYLVENILTEIVNYAKLIELQKGKYERELEKITNKHPE